MSYRLNLDSYLEDQRDDGEYQGSGHFTIEHQKAARKMARFALPRRKAWVCKIIQAAVWWSVDRIHVNQGKVFTVFHFEWSRLNELPTEDDVVKGILNSGLSEDHPMACLALGLRAMVEMEDLSFLLILNDGETTPKPIYAGSIFSEMPEEKRLAPSFGQRLGLTIHVAGIVDHERNGEYVGRASELADIAKELDKYCFLSPVPIILDGRRVDDSIRTPEFQANERFRPIYTGGPPADAEFAPLKLPESYHERRMSVYTDPRRALRPYHGTREFSAVVLLGMNIDEKIRPRRNVTIYWVRRGVIVNSKSFSVETETLVCKIYLDADHLPTDLTGFQIANAEAEKKEAKHLQQLKNFLSQLPVEKFAFAQDLDEHSLQDEKIEKSEKKSSRVKRVLANSGTGLGLAFFSPVLGSLVTLGSIAFVYAFGQKDRDEKIEKNQASWKKRLSQDKAGLLRGLGAQRTLDGQWKSDSGSSVSISTTISGLSITIRAPHRETPRQWDARWAREWDRFEYQVAGIKFVGEVSDNNAITVTTSQGNTNIWHRL